MNKPHLNKKFEKHFIKLENYIKENIDFNLIEKKFFYKRFAQQIWENSSYLRYSPYLDINSLKKLNKFKNDPKCLNIMPGYIRVSDGRFILGFSSFLKIFLIYLANLFYFAIMIIISIFNIKKKITYNVLFYSFERTTLKRLVNDLFDFLNNFEGLNSKKKRVEFIVDSKSKFNTDFIYARNQLLLITLKSLPRKNTFSLFLNFISTNIYFILKLLKNPEIIILYKDILNLSIAKELNNANLINSVIFTTSYFSNQPMWSNIKNKNFKSIFLWDSPSVFYHLKFENFEESVPFQLKYIEVDTHYVLSEYQKSIAKKFFLNTKINLLENFYRKKKLINKNSNIKVITAFTVNLSPFKSKKYFGGEATNYHNTKNLKNFIINIVEIIEELNKLNQIKIKLLIKSKNKNKFYNKFLSEIKQNYNFVKVVNEQIELNTLLSYSDIVISAPLTSPTFYNAILYKKTSLFYDPTSSILDNLNIPNVLFIKDKFILKKFIHESLSK